MTRAPDTAETTRRLRSIAAQRDGAEMLSCDDPAIHAMLSLYREACPAMAYGLRARADAFECLE